MKFLRYVIIALLLGQTGTTLAQTVDTLYTLQQCIDIAIRNNLDVKKSEITAERDRIYWNQARENLLPTFSASINHGVNNGRSVDPTTYQYTNQQTVYAQYYANGNLILSNGLTLINTIKQTSLNYQAGKLDYQQAKNDITLNVISTYLQALESTDALAVAAQQIEVSQQQVNRLDILNKDGSISPADLSDLRGQLAANKLSLIDARNAMYAAKLNLLQLMNVNYNRDVKLQRLSAEETPGKYKENAEQVYSTALNTLPLVAAADLRYKGTQKEVAAVKGLLFPTLALTSGLQTNYANIGNSGYWSQLSNNYNYGFGLGLQIPILNGFRARNNVKLAKLDMLNARYTTETTKITLKKNVDQAYINMLSAYERYQTTHDQVDAYTQSFNVAQAKFNAGVLTSVDFVTVKQRLDSANLNLISARYDYFIRAKILDYYQGKLNL
ncbi:TolC family protein [Mucilaginibacter ginkgonis]|uniref:TolC family protein n=1 Tax=Mucilaginibacter ginkgonis TaxID=2682091 RepID=A0A6I4HX77_9SPHI|nr:TolC family protein [Mucilaginibacter ginkgonis]QQL51320.1 TolC family protein [Mucilaginibacter ginkgonis]